LKILPLVCILIICVFTTTASANQQTSFLAKFEQSIGQSAREQLITAYGGEWKLELHQYLQLQEILLRLTTSISAQENTYSLTVLNTPIVNAFSLPGGFVFITRGMLDLVKYDVQKLAAVLAHEIAHIHAKHGISAMLRRLGLSVMVELGKFILEVPPTQAVQVAAQALIEVVQSGYSREAEFQADLIAIQYLQEAHFDPAGLIHVLSDLAELQRADSTGIFASHPDISERINRLLPVVVACWQGPDHVGQADPRVKCSSDHLPQDPLGRYQVEHMQSGTFVSLYDSQNNCLVDWFTDFDVQELVFAPDGSLIATVVRQDGLWHLWLWNRYGMIVEHVISNCTQRIANMVFSPDGSQLAYNLYSLAGPQLQVSFIGEPVKLNITPDFTGEIIAWQTGGLLVTDQNDLYRIIPPEITPVTLPEPVPRVLEPKYRVKSEIWQQEGDVYILKKLPTESW